MGSQHRSIGLALGVLFLASCAGSSIDNSAANAPLPEVSNEPQEAADAANIIVTGSRTSSANQKAMRAEGLCDDIARAPASAARRTGHDGLGPSLS
jgi:hypothetical protein